MLTKNQIIAMLCFVFFVVIIEMIIPIIPKDTEPTTVIVPKKLRNKVKATQFQLVRWKTVNPGKAKFPSLSTASKTGKCSYVLPINPSQLDNTHLQAKGLDVLSPVRVFENEEPLQAIDVTDGLGDKCIGISSFLDGKLYFSPTTTDIPLSDLSLGYVQNGKDTLTEKPTYWLFEDSVNIARIKRKKIICEQEPTCTDPSTVHLKMSFIALSKVKKGSFVFIQNNKHFLQPVEGNRYQVNIPLVNVTMSTPIRIKSRADFIIDEIILSSDEISISILDGKRLQ